MIAGCKGQIGMPLAHALCHEVGAENVIATDNNAKNVDLPCQVEYLDVVDFASYDALVEKHKVDYIVHLAAILSALGEKQPDRAMSVNVYGCINALNIARDRKCQIFMPSTIAVFGGEIFTKINTPVDSIL